MKHELREKVVLYFNALVTGDGKRTAWFKYLVCFTFKTCAIGELLF